MEAGCRGNPGGPEFKLRFRDSAAEIRPPGTPGKGETVG